MIGMRRSGFTLIELIVVLAIVALLASIVAPRYLNALDNGREAALRASLNAMRDAIDKYTADNGHYPDSLDDLVGHGYLKRIPEDPVTEGAETWQLLPPPPDSVLKGGMADVRSGALGETSSGLAYSSL